DCLLFLCPTVYVSCSPPTLLSLFFHGPPTTAIHTLSLHDALPIYAALLPPGRMPQGRHRARRHGQRTAALPDPDARGLQRALRQDRKSTRLNSSHVKISYAVFCLKKKK